MIHVGDCIEVMRGMPEASVDAVVTDPPYGLEFMGKGWDKFGAQVFHDPSKLGGFQDGNGGNAYSRSRVQFHNGLRAMKLYGDWCQAWGTEVPRVTQPGGYLLAFGGTRTHHRLVCGLEDAGWVIRDELDWIYASGFPKGKANLKPAHEPIVLARKPGPLRHLNIDDCRIEWRDPLDAAAAVGYATSMAKGNSAEQVSFPTNYVKPPYEPDKMSGRWPSNVLLSDPELFDMANPEVVGSGATVSSGLMKARTGRAPDEDGERTVFGQFREGNQVAADTFGDSGGYSRFFIIPKADRTDREPVLRGQLEKSELRTMGDGPEGWAHQPGRIMRENAHPTVKPVDLMRHLIRLVTPSGGTVLDPFLGSGSTAIACEMEGFLYIGIEQEVEYVAIAEARLNGTQMGLGLRAGSQ